MLFISAETKMVVLYSNNLCIKFHVIVDLNRQVT